MQNENTESDNKIKTTEDFLGWLESQPNPAEACRETLTNSGRVWEAVQRQKQTGGVHPRWFQIDSLKWFQSARHKSSWVHRVREIAELNHWSEQRLLLTLVQSLCEENETIKERLAQYIGRFGLPTDSVVEPRS